MARASKNFVDKILEAVPTKQVAEKDPMHHIELELSSTLKQMFEEAKEESEEDTTEEETTAAE